jgi:hypothetical protein
MTNDLVRVLTWMSVAWLGGKMVSILLLLAYVRLDLCLNWYGRSPLACAFYVIN